jgi:ribosome-binding protein aMBF1 (putative translation factor)
LVEARIKKGYSQKEMAEKLFMDVSNYNRRENGQMTISNQEWEKLSNLLENQCKYI